MTKRLSRNVIIAAVAVVMIIGLVTCGNSATGNPTDSASGVKVWRGTIAASPVTLNPYTASGSSDFDMQGFIYSYLLRRDPFTDTFTYIGDLAEDLPTVSEDGLTWTFRIRRGLSWSDGTPINAHSVEYSFRQLIAPGFNNRNATGYWDTIQVVNARAYFLGDRAPEFGLQPVSNWEEVGCKATDDYTIVFTLAQRAVWLTAARVFGGLTLVHQALYEAGFNDRDNPTETSYGTTDYLNFPSMGPYKLVEYVTDQWIAYERNENHPLVRAGKYPRERFEYRYVDQASVRDQLFEAGSVDSLSVTSASYEKYRYDPRTLVHLGGQPWSVYINMTSTTNPILTDPNFRYALFYGIDRALIGQGVFRTYISAPFYIMTDALVGDPQNLVSYRSTPEALAITPPNDGYDPDRALRYFNQAYAANGNRRVQLSFTYFDNSDDMKRMAEVCQEEWMKLFGADRLEITLRAASASSAYQSYRDRNYDLGIGSVGQDAINIWSSLVVFTSTWTSKNDGMYNAEFDELFRRTNTGDLLFASPQERLNALVRMEQIIYQEMPYIPIFQNTNWVVYADRVTLMHRDYTPGIGFIVTDVTRIPLMPF